MTGRRRLRFKFLGFVARKIASLRQGCGSGYPVFLHALDPDPVYKFLWIRILEQKKECRKGSKSDLSEENLKIMTKDRQKMKKATISY